MKQIGRQLTFANVIACLALFIALGGASYAAFRLPKNSVGAKQLKKGAVTPAKLSVGAKTTMRGATGPKGDPGPQGPKGETGAPATALWAVVNEEGELLHGTALSSQVTGAGTYFVDFGRDVSGCAAVADSQGIPAMAVVSPGTNPNRLVVLLEGKTSQVLTTFSLAVFC
jgi:hypothetical protein